MSNEDARAPESHSPSSYEAMSSPALRLGWLLRTAAITAVLAAIVSALIAPGAHGTFADLTVDRVDALATLLSYGMGVLLMIAVLLGAWDLGRAGSVLLPARLAAIGPSLIVVGLFLPACATRLPAIGAALLVLTAGSVSIVAALAASRAPHTRAAAIALGLFGFAALVRLLAWHLATYAALHASVSTWGVARALATLALVLDAGGQMVIAAWLGARGKLRGQVASAIALSVAFFVVWASSNGQAPWRAMLHLSLVDAGGTPPPFGGSGIAAFMVTAPLALACAVLAQLKPPPAVTTVLALALVGHGALDAPLRALAAVAASVWAMVTMADQRAMWKSR